MQNIFINSFNTNLPFASPYIHIDHDIKVTGFTSLKLLIGTASSEHFKQHLVWSELSLKQFQ